MVFKSKKSGILFVLIWGCIMLFTGIAIFYNSVFIRIGSIFIVAFLLLMWFKTHYSITNKELVISSGVFKWSIPIDTIHSIHLSSNIMASPALSFNRIDISYSNYKNILISPQDKDLFIKRLIEINPNIKINNI
ncbi:PH domain-containing protein [Bacillus sp. DX4.1]|uniref:PH domain-containing protein n=1 Tax=Bacillus sp. DX4.1 TaxID=3055867 RepID=UPI0025A237AF|nr:PH domain-containing protein [Bacillus sp. DX4.1]MDM5187285.1 PH domain-containing protein [Bacillus sp. DX4.1]